MTGDFHSGTIDSEAAREAQVTDIDHVKGDL
jgi:hypothetical protein